jgi:predicted alpha/beta-fold hydrolase
LSISENSKEADLYAVQISLEANYLMNIVAQEGSQFKVIMSKSNPFNIEKVLESLKSNRLISWIILSYYLRVRFYGFKGNIKNNFL